MVKIFHIKGSDEDYISHPNSCGNVDQLNNYMNDDDNKIFMVVYRPSCPACQNFIPTWEQFENKCEKKNKNIVIARVHSSNVPKLDIKPKVEFVPHITKMQDNNFYDYDRDSRTITDLMEWVGDDEDDEISYFGGTKRKYKKSKKSKKSKKKSKRKSKRKFKKSKKHRRK